MTALSMIKGLQNPMTWSKTSVNICWLLKKPSSFYFISIDVHETIINDLSWQCCLIVPVQYDWQMLEMLLEINLYLLQDNQQVNK